MKKHWRNVRLPQTSLRGRDQYAESAFTLLELVVSVTVFALLSGFLVPLLGSVALLDMEGDTRSEMETLAEAILEFTADTGVVPASLEDLVEEPEGTAGWSGPYFESWARGERAAIKDPLRDFWLEPYILDEVTDDSVIVRSKGENRTQELEDGDDIVIEISLSPWRRETTLDEMRTINTAIATYNELHLPAQPLPPQFNSLLDTLQLEGILAGGAEMSAIFRTDGWGRGYLTVGSPVIGIVSRGTPNPLEEF